MITLFPDISAGIYGIIFSGVVRIDIDGLLVKIVTLYVDIPIVVIAP